MKKLFSVLAFMVLFGLTSKNAAAFCTDCIIVNHYDISANIRNLSTKTIQATVNIHASFRTGNINKNTLYLLKLTTTSVQTGSIPLSFQTSDSTLEITLDKTYNIKDTINLTISYEGSPVLDSKWGGFYFNGNYAFNMGVGMGSIPPSFGRCWFPCADNFHDRSTYSFHITTDSGFVAVCSGLQEPKTINADGSITWHWNLTQYIPSYLASVAVGKYKFVEYNFTGIQSSYPVILAAEAKDTSNFKASFVRLNNALQCFEEKFGPYLFDRVGFVAVPFNSGAMEHACNIAYPIYAIDGTTANETLFAHELSHHWWGNLATCREAEDMWLNEGWASYCEALFLECVYGKDAYNADINNKLFTVLRWAHVRDGGYRAVKGIPAQYTYGTHVYKKGALMVHTLRTLMGDTAFFAACKSYLNKEQFSDVASSNLKIEFGKFTPYDLNHFFDSWILDKGHTDLQFVSADTINSSITRLNFFQLSRWKTKMPQSFPIQINYHLANGNTINRMVNLISSNGKQFDVVANTADVQQAAFISINESNPIMFGKTFEKQTVKTTGVKSFPNALLTITATEIPDSALLYVEHHFATPYQSESLILKNIRISSERYWHIDGIWPATFKATAFFNYDGSTPASNNSGFLDNELITGTEDSLVLLYRPNNTAPFTVHTDNTKQMGGTTDKTGRFWVNKLQKGDYVFGYYDVKAGMGSVDKEKRLFKIFPNPSEGIVKVEFPFEHKIGIIEVYDISGKLVHSENIEPDKNELIMKTPLWKPGSYILKFKDSLGQVNSKFIVN